MPVPAQHSAQDESSSSAAGASSGVQVSSQAASASADGELPVVGACWRGKYDIIEQRGESAGARTWLGRAVDGGHEVLLRAFHPAEPEVRAQAWAKLGGIDSSHVQRAREAQKAGDWRIEIADFVQGTPLHVWRAGRAGVDGDTVKAIVAQLMDAIGSLHAFELVHLDLRPDNVLVRENGGSIDCLITGFDALTAFDRKEPVPAAVDPFYAPPEALGLNVHVPGPRLCGWDWWSLGRIAQELVLGRHIAGHLTKSETRPASAAARAKAEELLFEADQKGPHAGAVELMPGPLDPQLAMLLKGLLTSPLEERWTGDNVDRWIRGQAVKEHYESRRAETHFRWRGRPCAVPEIAGVLQSADNWGENNVQLYDSTTPGTLAHFLRWSTSQSDSHEKLTSSLELAESLPLKLSTPAAQRETVIMFALLQLSGAKLIWRGRPFENSTVPAMMDELGEADAIMVLRALTTRSTALQIERIDASAGRVLNEIGRTVSDAESLLRRLGCAPNEPAIAARVHRLAVEPVPSLRATRELLARKYAGSDLPHVEKLFKAQNVGRAELVVLAWLSEAPDRFKFYTHAEAARRRAEIVRAHAAEVSAALTWLQLERAEKVGLAVIGGWGTFALVWILVWLATAVLWPGPIGLAYGLLPVAAALVFRMAFASRQQRAIRAYVPDVVWSWRDGPARCRRELRLAGHGLTPAALTEELRKAREELASLGDVQPAPAPVPELPRFGTVRIIGVLSWSVVAASVATGGWRVYRHAPSPAELRAAWSPKPKLAQKQETTVKVLDKAVDSRIPWPYKPDDNALKVTVRRSMTATSAQRSFALAQGREMVSAYDPKTIGTMMVMPVTLGNEVGMMIFDGKRGELMNEQIYIPEFRPIPRTWVEVGGFKGVYLDP